jgi:hypothetical protein
MKKTLLLYIALLLFAFNVKSQNDKMFSVKNSITTTKGLYLGGVASTNGWGAEVKYLFNEKFTVKTGAETLNFSASFNFDENDISYDGSVDYKTGGIFLLADYNFVYHLYLSSGVVFNSFNPEVTGHSVSPLEYGDITIPAEDVGDFKFSFSPKTKVSPYGGLGWRSFIGKDKRLALNFETGIYYMGSPQVEIEATGLLAPTADPALGQKEKLESQLEQYKIYPVIKFNLAVKLF